MYFFLLYRVKHRLPTPRADDSKQRKLEQAALSVRELSDADLRPLHFLYRGYRYEQAALSVRELSDADSLCLLVPQIQVLVLGVR